MVKKPLTQEEFDRIREQSQTNKPKPKINISITKKKDQ